MAQFKPMSSKDRGTMYQNILEKRLRPEAQTQMAEAQQTADLTAGVGSGIEQILKGMFAGGAGAKDTGHWEKTRQLFKQRADDRQKNKDSRISTIEKLGAHQEGQEANDPNSQTSKGLQDNLLRVAPKDPATVEAIRRLPASKIFKVAPWLLKDRSGGGANQLRQLRIKKLQGELEDAPGIKKDKAEEKKKKISLQFKQNYDRDTKAFTKDIDVAEKMAGFVISARAGNQEAVSQLQYLGARLTNGPGVLTDNDLKNAGVNQSVVDKFKAWAKTGAVGELNEDEIAAFERIGKGASKRARANIEKVQKNYRSFFDDKVDERIIFSGQRMPEAPPKEYPKTFTKGDQTATISNAEEEKDATSKGWSSSGGNK